MEETLIYIGIADTSIKYIEEDIEILLNREINLREKDISEENGYLSASRVCQLLRMKRQNLQLLGKSAHVHRHKIFR